jgi:hypothetical protein
MSKEGLTGDLYEMKILPNTASELVKAIYEQKDLSQADAYDMAAYLDKRYKMSGWVPPTDKYTLFQKGQVK